MSKNKLEGIMSVFIIVMMMFAMVCAIGFHRITEDSIDVTINDKRIITTGGGGDSGVKVQMTVYADVEVFTCDDSWSFMKFNSSDVFNQIKKNNMYKLRVSGWRVPFLSMYRNIISVKILDKLPERIITD